MNCADQKLSTSVDGTTARQYCSLPSYLPPLHPPSFYFQYPSVPFEPTVSQEQLESKFKQHGQKAETTLVDRHNTDILMV